MSAPRVAAAALALAACATAPDVRPAPARRPEPPRASAPAVPACAAALVADEYLPGAFDLPRVTAAGSAPRLAASGRVIARGDRIAAFALGAPVVALAAGDRGARAVTADGGLFAVDDLDAPPTLLADLGARVHPIQRSPAGELYVRDAADFGTLQRVDGARLVAVRGAPPSTVRDAAFFAPDRAILLLAGGAVARLDVAAGTATRIATPEPVRELVLAPDGVYGALAPARLRTDFTRPPEIARQRLAVAALDVPPERPPREPTRCHPFPLGPTCTLTVCDRQLSMTCAGETVALDPLPAEGGGGFVHPVTFGDDRRFVVHLGHLFLATREGARVAFRAIEPDRGWSREVRAAHGRWLHLPSTRDHHAPGETDAIYDLETGETLEIGVFRGRARSRLLADGTLFSLRLASGVPEASLGPPPGPLAPVALPPGALDAAFLDARRGVAVGADGAALEITCDGGSTWSPVPFEAGERARALVPADDRDAATRPLVDCAEGRCRVALDPPVALDFDAARARESPRPLAPVRPVPDPPPQEPLRRYMCRPRGPRRPPLPPVEAVLAPSPGGCAAEWRGRDARGAYEARSRTLACASIPETAREALAATRAGVLFGDPHRAGSVWVVAGGGVHRIDHPGRVRALALPDGRVLEHAETGELPVHAALLGASGVIAEGAIDFGWDSPYVGAFLDEAPALLAIAGLHRAGARAFRVPLDGGLPSAVEVSFTPCPREGRADLPAALLPMAPIWFDGPDDRPYAYSAELRVGPGACAARIRSWQGDLQSDGAGFAGAGFVCH